MRRLPFWVNIGLLLIIFRLFYLQVIKGEELFRLSKTNAIRIFPIKASRGRIFDRNGEILVDNRLTYELAVFPQSIDDSDEVLKKISLILNIPFKDLKSSFLKNKRGILAVSLVKNLDKEKAIIIEELKDELKGVVIQNLPQRFYPYKKLASHILGYLSSIDWWRLSKWQDYGYTMDDTVGYCGIEERYDYYLKGKDGGMQWEVDNCLRLRNFLGVKLAQPGKDIKLTIDLRIQKIVEEVLKDWQGAVVMLQPYSGEVVALASYPDFSPEDFLNRSASLEKVFFDPSSPLINRAINVYPVGSVFKLVVAVAGLENKVIDLNTHVYCEGSLKIGKREFGCWNKHGSENIIAALRDSCDVFFYRLGLLLGPYKLADYALKFGLGKSTQIDLPEEKEGYVPHPLKRKTKKMRDWFDGDTANFAVGQGELLVSPLQAARLVSVFANGGRLIRPYLVQAIDGKDISAKQIKSESLAIKTEILEIVKKGMEEAVRSSQGTAHILYMPQLSVAGKTGTAQVAGKQSHAWFAGFFPVDKPRYSICVFLEHAGSSINACQVARIIIERMQKEGLL